MRDLLADSRLDISQTVSRTPKRSGVGDGRKRRQMPYLHPKPAIVRHERSVPASPPTHNGGNPDVSPPFAAMRDSNNAVRNLARIEIEESRPERDELRVSARHHRAPKAQSHNAP